MAEPCSSTTQLNNNFPVDLEDLSKYIFEPPHDKTIRNFNGHLPYPFQNPISNFYLSLEAGKSSTDSVILRKLTDAEIIFRAWTKSLKRTKLYFDD